MTYDVPLICDPVPGPLPIVIDYTGCRVFPPWSVSLLRDAAAHLHAHDWSVEFPAAGRTEWPDAEFCAA